MELKIPLLEVTLLVLHQHLDKLKKGFYSFFFTLISDSLLGDISTHVWIKSQPKHVVT